MKPLRVFTSASVLLFLIMLLEACDSGSQNNKQNVIYVSSSIDRAEVEALFARAVQYGKQGDFNGLCESVALSDLSCKSEIYSADQAGWHPGLSKPVVEGVREIPTRSIDASPVLILEVSGERSDGTHFKSDFAAIRSKETTSFDVKVVTPVYWSGVKYRTN